METAFMDLGKLKEQRRAELSKEMNHINHTRGRNGFQIAVKGVNVGEWTKKSIGINKTMESAKSMTSNLCGMGVMMGRQMSASFLCKRSITPSHEAFGVRTPYLPVCGLTNRGVTFKISLTRSKTSIDIPGWEHSIANGFVIHSSPQGVIRRDSVRSAGKATRITERFLMFSQFSSTKHDTLNGFLAKGIFSSTLARVCLIRKRLTLHWIYNSWLSNYQLCQQGIQKMYKWKY